METSNRIGHRRPTNGGVPQRIVLQRHVPVELPRNPEMVMVLVGDGALPSIIGGTMPVKYRTIINPGVVKGSRHHSIIHSLALTQD